MRVIRHIPTALIDVDRTPMGRTLALVRYLESGGEVPPVHVRKTAGGRYSILDGRHRHLAFRLLGRTTILARWGEQ